MIRAFSAALLAFAFASVITAAPAHARKNHHQSVVTYDNDGHMRSARTAERRSLRAERRAYRVARASRHAPVAAMDGSAMPFGGRPQARADVATGPRQAQILGGRPAGCPRTYCGCGTSIKIFGRIRPELNLAANWVRKFPRTAAAPNMVAARSGHVMVLMEPAGGDKWKVWDANSGGGLTRIHSRSIRGFAIVNPHATSVAHSAAATSEIAAD